jgi:two-component system alkaline phosphatase synthesis response regulator PhoP
MKRILAVDDEPHILKLVSFSLKAHGFEVIEASNGAAACEVAEAELPDLILMDVMMPVMNGYDACESIKGNAKTAHIPVVMLSAKTQAAEQAEGLGRGALCYIPKPFTPKELVARVSELIGD